MATKNICTKEGQTPKEFTNSDADLATIKTLIAQGWGLTSLETSVVDDALAPVAAKLAKFANTLPGN